MTVEIVRGSNVRRLQWKKQLTIQMKMKRESKAGKSDIKLQQ